MASNEMQLSILNPNPSRLQGPCLLHELVQQPAFQHAPALDYLAPDGSRTILSYEELHRLSDALASRITKGLLKRQGNKQPIIPVLIPQCPELYVSLLAILKAGGAFCPLNLDAPSERVKFIVNDVSAHLVLTTSDLVDKIPDSDDLDIIQVDFQGIGIEPVESKPVIRVAHADDLAYVMYTSGSTGTPKGVGISHDAATQSLIAHEKHIPKFSRFLQFAAPTFDVSVFEIFFPLFRGSTLVSCDRAGLLSNLPGMLSRMEVDACELTPTVAASLLKSRENAPCLRLLLTIGEMLTEPVIRTFGGSADRPSMLWAMYGPTEATIHW